MNYRFRSSVLTILVLICLSPIAALASDGTFYVAIASDPQLDWKCVTAECLAEAKSVGDQAALSNHWQSDSINKLAAQYGSQFRGVVVNGDLTAFGHKDQLQSYFKHFKDRIHAPVFPGLGNHDYANNINDCWNNNCAVRMVLHMDNEVVRMGSQIKGYDLQVTGVYYKFPSLRKKYTGSLSYSFDLDGVHFVQLQNHPGYETSFDTWNFSKARRDHFEITPSFDWLEKDLAKAKQEGKTIIVNLHDFNEHMTAKDKQTFVNIMTKYGASAVFWGHLHESQGRSYSTYPIPGFISGSSSNNRYLLAKFVNNQLAEVSVINGIRGDTKVESTFELSH